MCLQRLAWTLNVMWIKKHNFIVHTLRNVMNLARVGHSLHAFCGAAHFYKKNYENLFYKNVYDVFTCNSM